MAAGAGAGAVAEEGGGGGRPRARAVPYFKAAEFFVAGGYPQPLRGVRLDTDALAAAAATAVAAMDSNGGGSGGGDGIEIDLDTLSAPTFSAFATSGRVAVGASGTAVFVSQGGAASDLVEGGQGVRAKGPPAALAALVASLEYRRPETNDYTNNIGRGGVGYGGDTGSSGGGDTGMKASFGKGTFENFGNFGKDEVALTLAAAGSGPAQQHRVGVSVRAGCTAAAARVSGDGVRGHSGPAGMVTAVEVACRDGTGARVDATAARDDVTVKISAGADYTQVQNP